MNISDWDLENKNVLLRIDGNVPLKNGTIESDFRLRALIPTLTLLTTAGAHITIATHIGRPKNKDPKLSTKIIKQWLTNNGFPHIKVLENLRFNPEELGKSNTFAKKLSHNIDYYINDAWGTLHRDETSTTLVPQLFNPKKRSLGLLVYEELHALEKLKNNPDKPYVVFLGGGKPATKIPIIENLIKQHHVSTIVVLPALAFTFLKAQGKNVGKSLVDDSLLETARSLIKQADAAHIKISIPTDYTYAEEAFNGPLKICDQDNFPPNGFGLGLGPQSIEECKRIISKAKTIFYNGAMGIPERPETLKPLHVLLKSIANSSAYTVIGGGNSVAEIEKLHLSDQIDFCSTGGGSTLLYISGGNLPGLKFYH